MPAKSAGLNQRGQISRGKPRQVTGDVAVNWVWVLGSLSVENAAPCPETPRSPHGLVGPGSSPGENGGRTGCVGRERVGRERGGRERVGRERGGRERVGRERVGRERVGRERVGRMKPFTRRTGARPAINPLPGERRIRFLSSRVKPRSGACGALDLKNRIRPAGWHGMYGLLRPQRAMTENGTCARLFFRMCQIG